MPSIGISAQGLFWGDEWSLFALFAQKLKLALHTPPFAILAEVILGDFGEGVKGDFNFLKW